MKEKIQNRELNIMNLLISVCLKWKSILIGGVCAAIIMGGLSYIKSYHTQKKFLELEKNPVTTADLTNVNLSESAEVYVDYIGKYEKQMYYNLHAPLMNLDPNGFYKGEITFLIDNGYTVEYPIIDKRNTTSDIMVGYQAIINDEDFQAKALQIAGFSSVDEGYVGELVDSNNKYGSSNSAIKDYSRGIMTISVYSMDKSVCLKLLDLIEESFEAKTDELKKSIDDHKLTVIEKNCFLTSEMLLFSVQRESIERLREYASRMVELTKNFDADDTEYVDIYRQELLRKEKEVKMDGNGDTPINASVSLKWILVGGIAGVFLMMALYVLLYVFWRRIRLEDDLDELLGVPMLGRLVIDKSKKRGLNCVFEKILYRNVRIFSEQNAIEMIAANIRTLALRHDAKKVYIIGSVSDESEKKCFDQISELMKDCDTDVQYGNSVLFDAGSCEQAAKSENVVVICRVGTTTYNELAEELDLLFAQKSNVLGLVLVDA